MVMKQNLKISIIISLIFLMLCNISFFSIGCCEIRNDVIRLHIIANSDSDQDQELKYKVRDRLLIEGQSIFDGTVTIDNAKEKIVPELKRLKAIADAVIKENGQPYTATISLCNEFFTTRTYDENTTVPAGNYLALKIILGNGEGKNWWCVMFPALCLPAVGNTDDAVQSVFSQNEINIIENKKKYAYKFKIVEYIEKIKNNVNNRRK